MKLYCKYYFNLLKILRAKFMLRWWIMGFKTESYYWRKCFPNHVVMVFKLLLKMRKTFKDKIWNQFSAKYGENKRTLEF